MEDAIVKLRNIHKTFGENAVLKGVDLDIRKGEVVTLMGPSGTGKTTLLLYQSPGAAGTGKYSNRRRLRGLCQAYKESHGSDSEKFNHGISELQFVQKQDSFGKCHGGFSNSSKEK